ncbi:unnamed protein product [Adineta ricciae]|uniref:Glucose-methanol-choline oxidoreductase N-terminal domain-containing protein n=1 Tax=Adineta ricciae TaxID=249248 RepID=A0A815WIH9_ADIRI|nr:unnamed protein product [Adineta ricciae]CAF1653279.1 unnamed protein product [Adineta ricciae]
MTSETLEIAADFVVVGGGSAGCVVATRLAEYGFETILISSGSNDTENPIMKLKSSYSQLYKSPQFKHYLVPEPSPNLNNRTINVTVWNTLGGSSVNDGGMERMMANDWNAFVQATSDESFNHQHMAKYYKMSESFTSTDPSFASEIHGHSGPIKVTKTHDTAFNKVWKNVAKEIGEVFSDDLAGSIDYGFSFEASSLTNDVRSWSGDAYLISAVARYSNLKVILDATVIKFDLNAETKRINQVIFVSSDGLHSAVARKEYILSAGAFYSPHLLMLSGIGDSHVLKQNKIAVRHELKQVGKNLMDNGAVVVKYLTTGSDTGLSAPVALVNTRLPTTNYNPNLFFLLHRNDKTKHLYAVIFNASPSSTIGSVSLYNSNPLVPPKINLNYLESEDDIKTFVDGIHYVRKVMSTNAMNEHMQATEISPGTEEIDLSMYVRNTLTASNHFIGTCSMGESAQNSVVNSRFKVHGISNLRVVDGSVFPAGFASKTGPLQTIYSLAEKAAHLLHEEYS